MKSNILHTVESLLKQEAKYTSSDGELLKAKVHEDVMRMDETLLSLLWGGAIPEKLFSKK